MVLRKCATSDYIYSTMPQPVELRANGGTLMEADVGIDIQEVYFLIMHFLSVGPCRRTFGHFWNELLEHQLLPRRYHAWYSRNGVPSGDENDNGISFPLSYSNLMERYSHIEKDHLVKLLKQLIMYTASPLHGMVVGSTTNPVDVPTILGAGSFSLLESERMRENKKGTQLPGCLRWPYMKAGQVRGLALREIGGGFTKHHRAPSVQAACYAIAKPSTMAQKMQIIKKIRGHRLPVYCATFDRSGRYVITGSDDRLVKIWSMETAFCLSSCRGHEGDITDLAVSSNNTLVASASNDFTIRVWRLPDGYPISVLRGHTAAVTAIVFSPRTVYQLLSSSDDGTCRIWDARHSQQSPRIYIPKPPETLYENTNDPPATAAQRGNQILCCSYNANGTVFVTGSSDTYARVWNATVKFTSENAEQPTHEIDVLSGHEDDVNYVQFSGCAVPSRSSPADIAKEDNVPKFKNFWFPHDNIVTCSRDGSAIIWIPRSRRSHHAKAGRWIRAYHLKVPPPPMPLQPSRGGPRQRNQPTPRGVNMIVWSLDNRFVLAAIMDCRICVWNSVDGSLVHSLTGHSASTYVLDVHPFNPRIAMSAGYDGKTIIWDIWEGIPVRVYEIGCFKLVDGKFSPDGTSVVVSDEVGQLYIVATGQGESQKDAKYDQFFLGDYRPLVQDSLGNVVDQETQLAPHRRNIQDLLCDSSMIPYPEPYQNMYQQRRLGSLGIEWRPAPVAFAVGLGDNSQLQAHLLVPFVDPDRWHEPLPEFIEMDWERENEVQTDDTDSEYNIADECSSEGEAESLSNTYSENAECSGEDSEFGLDRKEGIRRSNRRKHMSEVEFMTSSGRRVKRRNLDERDGTMSALTRNSKSVRRKLGSKGKSSVSKLSRPRRRAAKNALSLFSQMNGTSTDGEKYDSESGSSNSGSSLLGSNIQSNESDRSIQHVKEAPTDECELMAKPSELPELLNGGKRRLILKFPIRASKTLGARWLEQGESSSQAAFGLNGSLDPEEVAHSLGNKECDGSKIVEVRRAENVEDLTNFSVGHHENKMKWGEVKARSSKRMRMTHEDQINNDKHKDNVANGDSTDSLLNCDEHVTPYVDEGIRSPHMNNQMHGHLDSMASINGENKERIAGNEHDFFATKASSLKDSIRCNGNYVESGSIKCKVYDEPLKRVGSCTDNGNALSLTCEEFTPDIQAAEQLPQPPTGRLRLRAKRNMNEPHSPTSSQNYVVVKEGWGQCSDEDNLQHEEAEEGDCTPGPTVDHHGRGKLKTHGDGSFGSLETRRYNAVYKRSKAHKSTVDSEMEENSLAENIANLDVKLEFIENEFPRRSRRMKATIPEATSIQSRLSEDPALAETSKHSENFVLNGRETHLSEEIYLNPRMITRSTRSRRGNLYDKELLSKRTTQATKKQSWLMLMEQEESYVPQLGDEVAYIIQGHKQYMQWSGRRFDQGPWEKFKRNIRAVELCRVLCLEYSSLPGSGESCCKLTLEFTDPVSSVYGETFKMTLPELVDFSDFVVLRSRYDAATMRCWSNRDKCEVWWNTGEGGNWYYGRIVSVKPISSEFPDSPWERYTVRYTNGSETYLHSPWELREPGSMWEYPQIDDNIRGKLLSSLVKLEHTSNHSQDSYGIQRLKQAAQKSDFLNRFPVPLSLDVVKQRLENNYYRSLESVKHDAEVILENGKLYFARNTEVITKLQRLQEWFRRTLSL